MGKHKLARMDVKSLVSMYERDARVIRALVVVRKMLDGLDVSHEKGAQLDAAKELLDMALMTLGADPAKGSIQRPAAHTADEPDLHFKVRERKNATNRSA